MTAEILISVVVCTRNRGELLKRALTSIVEQEANSIEFEVLVVDNGSHDNTPEVVKAFSSNQRVRYLFEATPGLCIARNAGWRSARGRYIAYFDDDAIASPGWLAAIARGFAELGDDVGVIGGPVLPIWERPQPEWLDDALVCSLTAINWGPKDKFIDDLAVEWLVGANFAIPRDVLESVGGFHPWLDRVGQSLLSSGDVYLTTQIMRKGYRCYYKTDMIIGHLVPASRLEKIWFRRRYFWQGVSHSVIDIIDHKPGAIDRMKLALVAGGRLFKRTGVLHALLRRSKNAEQFKAKCFALLEIGYIVGVLGAARH